MGTLTVRAAVPGTGTTIGIPASWRMASEPAVGLVAVEPDAAGFVANLSALLDISHKEALPDPASAAAAALVAPAVIDLRRVGDDVEVVICHLVGSVSATMRQRQIVSSQGLLVVTFTASTSRWADLCGVADEVFESIGAKG